MAGAYCFYCGHRCFVYRTLPDGSWSGHMATCKEGMTRDRQHTGFDHTTAINPVAAPTCAHCGSANYCGPDWTPSG